MDIESLLRSSRHRKRLVLAAESAVQDPATARLPQKTQLNRLVSICGEATCAEEISSYLRYQASRRNGPWSSEFAEVVIAKIKDPTDALLGELRDASDDDRDRTRVAAWRLYAVFLARAFTYSARTRRQRS